MKLLSLLFALFIAVTAKSQIITTVAGTGSSVSSGDGGLAILAGVANPGGGAFDKFGNYYFADGNANRIRKINSAGVISTVAGNGLGGFTGDGGAATAARLNYPQAVRLDTAGNLYIADGTNNRIRRVDRVSGIISTVAGNGVGGFSSDGIPATSAQIWNPQDVAVDTFGNIYIVDMFNYRIRKVDVFGTISTVAGTGTSGFTGDGGPATNAQLGFPIGVALDDTGNLYIADPSSFAARVRKVNTLGVITTIAGNGASVFTGGGIPATSASLVPLKVALDSFNNLYIADRYNDRVYKVDLAGILHHIAGNGVEGDSGDGGAATSASLFNPTGVAIDACGNVYIPTVGHVSAPGGGCRIRKVTYSVTGSPSTVSVVPIPNDTVCAGTSVTYSTSVSGGAPVGYQWYVNGAAVTGATSSTYSYTPANGDLVRCIGIVSASCNYTSDTSNIIHMVVNPIVVPTVNVTPLPDDTVCTGTSVTFNSSVTGGGTGATYQWYVNGMPVGTGTSYSYIPSNGDSVQCAYTSTSDCGGTVTVNSNMTNMVVNPLVIPTVIIAVSPDDTVCSGMPVTVSAVISGGSAVSYSWYKNGVVVSASGTTYTYVPANGDSVRCVVGTTEGCTGSAVSVSSNTVNMVVPVTVVPSINITSVPMAMVGDVVTVSATVSGASAYTIRWMNKGVVFNTTTVPLVTYVKGMGTDTITAKVIPTGVPCYDSVVSNMRQVSVKLGVASVPSSTVYVYPNPVGDELVVEHVAGCEMKVCDVVGRCVLRATIRNDVEVVDVSRLEGGVYVVVFSNDDGVKVVRVVKR